MKILFITYDFPPNIYGGSGIYAHNLVKTLKKNYEIEIDVLTINGKTTVGSNFISCPVKLIKLELLNKLYPFRIYEFAFKVNSFLKKNAGKYDLIHDSSNVAISLNTPIIHTVHSTLLLEFLYWDYLGFSPLDISVRYAIKSLFSLEKKAISLSSLIIAPSEDLKKHLIKYFKIEKDIKVIYYGIDTDLFCPINEIEKKYDLLFVGRIVPRKGIRIFFRVLEKIKDKKLKVCICAIKGRLWHYLLKHLKRSKHDIDLKTNIAHSLLRRFYNEALLTVFPSLYETFGMVMAESLASGTPVIAFNVAANSEIIINRENGLLVSPYNPEEFAHTISSLLTDKDNLSRMGELGRDNVLNKFNWENKAREIFESYLNFI